MPDAAQKGNRAMKRDGIAADAAHSEARGHEAAERRGLLSWLADWIETCADYYAALAMYEGLSRLSDAELHRRGLTRGSLARDVCTTFDRTSRARRGGRTPGQLED
jgi:hypothetical protein